MVVDSWLEETTVNKPVHSPLDPFFLDFPDKEPPPPKHRIEKPGDQEVSELIKGALTDHIAEKIGLPPIGGRELLEALVEKEILSRLDTSTNNKTPKEAEDLNHSNHDVLTNVAGDFAKTFLDHDQSNLTKVDLYAFNRALKDAGIQSPELVYRAAAWLEGPINPIVTAPILILAKTLPAQAQIEVTAALLLGIMSDTDSLQHFCSTLVKEEPEAAKLLIKTLNAQL